MVSIPLYTSSDALPIRKHPWGKIPVENNNIPLLSKAFKEIPHLGVYSVRYTKKLHQMSYLLCSHSWFTCLFLVNFSFSLSENSFNPAVKL